MLFNTTKKHLGKIKDLLLKYGYEEDEIMCNDKDGTINILDLVIITYNKKTNKYSISFSSSAFALGAAQLVNFFRDNGVSNISFLQNFFVADNSKILFGDEADDLFKEEMKREIVVDYLEKMQLDFMLMAHKDETVH